MSALHPRKIRILQLVVNDYVQTSRPVGSERLIEVYNLGCKSATVRNEMADLAEMGYLQQPHTSAGRIPTDRGYRFYVDQLMNPPAALSPQEVEALAVHPEPACNELSELVQETCRVLSNLTAYMSVATDPSTEVTLLRRIYLTEASPRHILLVVLLSTGQVEHRLIEVDTVPDETVLTRVAGFINSIAADREMTEVRARFSVIEPPPELHSCASLLTRVASTLADVAAAATERKVYLQGMNQILRQPEFQDVHRLETLLNALEQQGMLYQVLSRALPDCKVTVIIGSENPYTPMQDCSVITTSYHIGDRPAGYLGVVGPTRMNYDRATAAVGLMARQLSQMLTQMWLS
ncbi:MAG: heat-inducible transcriptional repressor HrcA [Chloroherpetonaceae bacterium]|nr:heat-inducible transcriptional repressor HrcA [Chthonomonadaceae bacterium]MDW8207256.1 heat-inducible transcriptional repressor HrcA [Chloroherpetonaceae bacterium]